MSGIRGVLKDGWHPKSKDGAKKESWRGDFKGIDQVAGWVGKGKGKGGDASEEQHVSRPITSLRDPSSFAPPPRRGTYGRASPGGLGSALTPQQLHEQDQRRQEEEAAAAELEAEAARPPPPPVPYRADTTGLSTAHLPKPPVKRNYATNVAESEAPNKPLVKQKPNLPPRLPPRNAPSNAPANPPSPPPAYQDSMVQPNHSALNRLGNAGVSVPSLGIGNQAPASQNTQRQQFNPQNELQQRFARMNTSSPPVAASTSTASTVTPAVAPAAQAHSFYQQPQATPSHQQLQRTSSTPSTHATQSPTGSQGGLRDKWNSIDNKYGIKKRINTFIDDQKSPAHTAPNQQPPPPPPQAQSYQQQPQYPQQSPYQQPQPQPYPSPQPQHQPPHDRYPNSLYSAPAQNTSRPDLEALNKRRPPPPPPPPKKPGLAEAVIANGQGQTYPGAPPPLPLATKPR